MHNQQRNLVIYQVTHRKQDGTTTSKTKFYATKNELKEALSEAKKAGYLSITREVSFKSGKKNIVQFLNEMFREL